MNTIEFLNDITDGEGSQVSQSTVPRLMAL